jgi:hypothetical protein
MRMLVDIGSDGRAVESDMGAVLCTYDVINEYG